MQPLAFSPPHIALPIQPADAHGCLDFWLHCAAVLGCARLCSAVLNCTTTRLVIFRVAARLLGCSAALHAASVAAASCVASAVAASVVTASVAATVLRHLGRRHSSKLLPFYTTHTHVSVRKLTALNGHSTHACHAQLLWVMLVRCGMYSVCSHACGMHRTVFFNTALPSKRSDHIA